MSVTTEMADRPDSAFQKFNDKTVIRDDQKHNFGTDGDASIKFNATNDTVQVEGKPLEPSKGVRSAVTIKDNNATLTQDELEGGIVLVTVTGKTMTLPAASATYRNVDCLIAPVGAISTTVHPTSGSFGVGGGSKDSAAVATGCVARVKCESYDGGTTYTWFISGLVVLS